MDQLITKVLQSEDELTLFLQGEINSVTAPDVEKDILKEAKKHIFSKLVLDFSQITYVSSAGLRVILKLKKLYDKISVINTSLAIYDVFSMTGFTNIIEVRKALVEIDVTGCEIIGEGYFSIVYRLDKDTIVKVYRRTTDIKEVERELNLAKEAFILGIPTAISYDVVKVGEKLGVRFEMIDSASLRQQFLDHPEQFDKTLKKYVELLKKTNSTEAMDDKLPKAKETWFKKLDGVKELLPETAYAKAERLLSTIPDQDTFIHGDSHFKNIMVQGGELLFIDMDTLCTGYPIFELATGIYTPYYLFEEDEAGNNVRFLGVGRDLTDRICFGLIDKYLGRKDPDALNKIRIVSLIHFLWWCKMNEPEKEDRRQRIIGRLLPLLDQYDDLDLGL